MNLTVGQLRIRTETERQHTGFTYKVYIEFAYGLRGSRKSKTANLQSHPPLVTVGFYVRVSLPLEFDDGVLCRFGRISAKAGVDRVERTVYGG